MDTKLITTTFTLEGYKIIEQLGVVRGIAVRSRSIIGNFGAAIQTIFGGNISIFAELCENARQEAFSIMIKHATALESNAIIGVRYDATEVMDGVTEMVCYGTAVKVEKA